MTPVAEHAVVIAGAGPTGLMLAAELALAHVDVVVLERRASQQLMGARAGGLHARTMEIFDQRGIVDRFLAEGTIHHTGPGFSLIPLSLADAPSRHNYVLGLWQTHIERILAERLRELGVAIHYGASVAAFTQDEAGVDITLDDGSTMRARYLVGCDGGRSTIRKLAGIDFPGSDPTTSNIIGEVQLRDEPPSWGIHRDSLGIHSLGKTDDGRVRVLVTERTVGATREPTLDDLREALVAAFGSDFGAHDATWLSRFTDAIRQASSYRAGRVFLAGDAAHVHPPDGGQGLQIGVQDAFNLGWKLAQVIDGTSSDALLDTYHAERHPVGARVLHNTKAAIALRRADDRTQALRDLVAELLGMDQPRRHFAAMLTGLDVHYALGDGHALLGRRMPALDIVTANGASRVYEFMHDAKPLLVNFGAPNRFDVSARWPRVRTIDARCDGEWTLPVIGTVAAPDAVLVRPDGYVAWVGEGGRDAGLVDALTTWFGAPRER